MTCSRPIKVLQIIDTLGMGGAETWLMEVLRLWAKNGDGHLDFVATSGNAGIFDDEARQLGAQVHYLRYGRPDLPHFTREFRWVLREGKYDAIHDHQDYASGWHFLMGGDTLPPVRVTHIHNPSYQILNNYGVTMSRRITAQIGKRLIAHYATHITGTSRQVIREYGFDARTFARIPKAALHCGFQVERFRGNSADAKASIRQEFGWPREVRIILFVGRMDESVELGHPRNHKNSAFAVSVGIECVRNDEHVRMLLAGASSGAVPLLEERIAAAGLNTSIRFVGIRKDIERLMTGSDVLLFPSRGEGLGMAAVEAQAAGLPVLAAETVPRECVVVPELVRFLKVEDGVKQWATTLRQLYTERSGIADANQKVGASAFSIDRSAGALLQLYGQVVLH
jgi:glycosyltransferase involved in cell wall biosynthesis